MAYITSIQKVQVTIAASSATGTATISSVDTSQSFVVWGGYTTNAFTNAIAASDAYIELTNATTITATRNASGSGTITVECTVIECGSELVDSVQRGLITVSDTDTSNTATITSVGTGNSVVTQLGKTTNNSGTIDFQSDFGVLALDDATTVSATRGGSDNDITISYEVIEFNSDVVESLQQEIITLTGTNTTDGHTITSVDVDNTLLFYGGCSGNIVNATVGLTQAILTSSTNINLVRGVTTTATRYVNVTALEFVGGVMDSVQRGEIVIGSGTSQTATITSVTTADAAVAMVGLSNISGNTLNRVTQRLDLTNATTVTDTREGSTGLDTGCAFEVWEFSDGPVTGSVASSSGSATVTGVGVSQAQATAGSVGTSTASAIGASTFEAVGSSTGTSTVSGVSFEGSVGLSEGTSTTSGVGASTFEAVGSSTGTSTASATGASNVEALVSSTGTSTVSGVGASTFEAVGSSTCTATASATGASTFEAVGLSTGTSTASGVSFGGSVGSSTGTSTASATGVSTFEAVGSSTGTSTASGVSVTVFEAVGLSEGASTASATGASTFEAVGSSTCTATASAIGASTFEAVGSSTGTSTVSGVSFEGSVGLSESTSTASATGVSTFEAVGSSTGTSTASAIGPTVAPTTSAYRTKVMGLEVRTRTPVAEVRTKYML